MLSFDGLLTQALNWISMRCLRCWSSSIEGIVMVVMFCMIQPPFRVCTGLWSCRRRTSRGPICSGFYCQQRTNSSSCCIQIIQFRELYMFLRSLSRMAKKRPDCTTTVILFASSVPWWIYVLEFVWQRRTRVCRMCPTYQRTTQVFSTLKLKLWTCSNQCHATLCLIDVCERSSKAGETGAQRCTH